MRYWDSKHLNTVWFRPLLRAQLLLLLQFCYCLVEKQPLHKIIIYTLTVLFSSRHCALGSASMCCCVWKILTNTHTSIKCLPPTCDHAHTEHIVLICCTFPKSISSCFIRHLSWGSLARGSGGSNSPVKSNQLSNTEPTAGVGSKTTKYIVSSCQDIFFKKKGGGGHTFCINYVHDKQNKTQITTGYRILL